MPCGPISTVITTRRRYIGSSDVLMCAAGVQPASVRSLQTGVGDGSTQYATFSLYTEAAGECSRPEISLMFIDTIVKRFASASALLGRHRKAGFVTGWSSMQPDNAEVEANMGVFLRRSLASGAGIAPGWAARAGRLLQVSHVIMLPAASAGLQRVIASCCCLHRPFAGCMVCWLGQGRVGCNTNGEVLKSCCRAWRQCGSSTGAGGGMYVACCVHGRRSHAACVPSPTSCLCTASGNEPFKLDLNCCACTLPHQGRPEMSRPN